MQLGLSAYDVGATELVELAALADELGFDSVWLGEHLALPVDYKSDHPTVGTHQHIAGAIVDPRTHLLDPMVALAAAAARTSRLLLATGIYLLPLRQPLLTARAGATLAELSGQRVLLGVGAGWLREEFDALGVPFDERYSRLVETVEILRTAWAGGPFSHHGRHFDIDSVQLCEDPVRVPLILGGNGPLALRRAAALGDGWMSSGTPQFEEAMVLRDRLTALRQAAGIRGEFPLWFRIANPDPALVERYRREGFTNLLVWADQVKSDGDYDLGQAMVRVAAELGMTKDV